ncbi:MAG: pesticidal protein Cry15Aa [Anaerolinea sp.]|nr:pesticidal protein Cry15Aa [Anaerolinea sp.]
MIIIKRYPNRKLYDTSVKRYITLDGISDLIREGKEVQVLDHNTGEDLTAITLTQIIFEQEKKNAGFLPRAVLTGLVKAGGETISTLRRTLASPLDMLNQVDEEIERRIQHLVRHGELAEEEGSRVLDKLVAQSGRFLARVISEEDLEKYLEIRGVPTKKDLQTLATQLDNLAVALEELQTSADKPPESL